MRPVWQFAGASGGIDRPSADCRKNLCQSLDFQYASRYPENDGKRIAIKNERQTMHLLFLPVLADDTWVAPSGAAFIVILTVLAALRGR
jgi:hypothetical protein